jgi:hypothetical protein
MWAAVYETATHEIPGPVPDKPTRSSSYLFRGGLFYCR